MQQNVHIVESVRDSVQWNWPDAETGVPPEERNRACSVLTNVFDKGTKDVMIVKL